MNTPVGVAAHFEQKRRIDVSCRVAYYIAAAYINREASVSLADTRREGSRGGDGIEVSY